MKLTKDDVQRIAQLVPAAKVEATDGGIRLHDEFISGDAELVEQTMRAALTLGLDPRQVVCNSDYEEAYSYSTLTGGGGYNNFDVTFLYEPKE